MHIHIDGGEGGYYRWQAGRQYEACVVSHTDRQTEVTKCSASQSVSKWSGRPTHSGTRTARRMQSWKEEVIGSVRRGAVWCGVVWCCVVWSLPR
mmetsp:Transcript_25152/g.72607  ORF Transcript_25152/g.72607 Transcript_25152/m.72607 type:complete len:94 (+) Transcript_25152:482-763(+)